MTLGKFFGKLLLIFINWGLCYRFSGIVVRITWNGHVYEAGIALNFYDGYFEADFSMKGTAGAHDTRSSTGYRVWMLLQLIVACFHICLLVTHLPTILRKTSLHGIRREWIFRNRRMTSGVGAGPLRLRPSWDFSMDERALMGTPHPKSFFSPFISLASGCAGSSCCAWAFPSCGARGLLFLVVQWASHCSGLSSCGARALGAWAQ